MDSQWRVALFRSEVKRTIGGKVPIDTACVDRLVTECGFVRLRRRYSGYGRRSVQLHHICSVSGDKGGPLLHQSPPQLKQIRALVRRLNPVRIDVRQGQLADFSRLVGPLGGPLPER